MARAHRADKWRCAKCVAMRKGEVAEDIHEGCGAGQFGGGGGREGGRKGMGATVKGIANGKAHGEGVLSAVGVR